MSFVRGALLWAAFAVPALTADRVGLNEPRPGWQQAAGVVVLAVTVAVSRRLPLVAFGLAAALNLAAAPAMFTVSYGPALSGCALLLGLRAARARPAVLCFTAVGCAGTARIALVGVDPAPEWLVMTGTLLFGCVFPWLGGRYWQQSRELAEAGWLRAARLEDEARFAEERARLRERARIAQDMHDSLGHELSLIALRAGALQVAPGLGGEHRAAAADLRTVAADATDRLHRIIGVLREGNDEPVPLTPAGETLEHLVTRAAESGLAVRWESAGRDPAADSDEVTERLLHHVAREALTNAARHAPGAPVAVAVTGHAAGTAVTITSGRATQDGSPPPGGGTGLLGLRAAVTSVGGEFEAGPHGEGFRARAFVPRQQRTAVMPARPGRARFTHARRRAAVGLATAAGVGGALVGAAVGWYAWTEKRAVLEPAVYAALRPGAPAADVERMLPEGDVRDPPAERAPTPEPEGADCRYYRASGELFVSVDHFRLCFDGGRLVAKDVVPRAGLSREGGEDDEEFSP